MLAGSNAFASAIDDTSAYRTDAEATRATRQSFSLFLTELRASFAQASAEALPQQVVEASRLRPDSAAKIVAEGVRAVAANTQLDETAKRALVESIVSQAVAANRQFAVAITRKAVEAAPQFRDVILAGAMGTAEDLRLAMLRAADEGAMMRSILARVKLDTELPARGTINPGNVAGGNERAGAVRSPEQPPNNNPPNNNPPNNPPKGNPPRGNPPKNAPPRDERPRHGQPPHIP